MSLELTIDDFLEAARIGVRGRADKNADFVRGSDYESLLGPSAMVWSRESERDTDLFDATSFNTAEGEDLTELALRRYGKVRVLDTRGKGMISLARPAGGIQDTVWAGTRFSVPGNAKTVYRATQDVPVASSDLAALVPVVAVIIGSGSAIQITVQKTVRIDDALLDSTWYVSSLICGDGTDFEPAQAFRTRIRRERQASRVGQTASIIAACKKAGAENVVLFGSAYAGDAYDYGLNYCYVGDSGYNASQGLVTACLLALEANRVCGDNLQVLPMVRTQLNVTANIYLYDTPALFDLTRIEKIQGESILQYLNGTSGRFNYSLDGIIGALAKYTPEVQRVVVTTPSVDGTIVVGPDKNFPASLPRYVAGLINFNFFGPT